MRIVHVDKTFIKHPSSYSLQDFDNQVVASFLIWLQEMVQKESIILGLNRCQSASNIKIFGLTYVYYKADIIT